MSLVSGLPLMVGLGIVHYITLEYRAYIIRLETLRSRARIQPKPEAANQTAVSLSAAAPNNRQLVPTYGTLTSLTLENDDDYTPLPITFSCTYTVGPMVGQSDHAFRLLTRHYGATVTYTPMLYAHHFMNEHYRQRVMSDFDPSITPSAVLDHPLIVQFAANDPQLLLKAAKQVEHLCEAIDINLGCPQDRARASHFGAYLTSRRDWPIVAEMVRTLHHHLTIPVTCKIRLLSSYHLTLEFCLLLQRSGCSMIAIHGRQRGSSNHRRNGLADLEQIMHLNRVLRIPIIANGNIRSYEDARRNIKRTNCAGVMSAEAVLANPRLFSGATIVASVSCMDLANEYLDYCCRYPPLPPLHWMSDHVHNILRATIQLHHPLLHFRTQLKSIGRESSEYVLEIDAKIQSHDELLMGVQKLRLLLKQFQLELNQLQPAHSTG